MAVMVLDGVEITAIGRVDEACPSCGVIQARRPARKTPCSACGEPIHCRTRPLDGLKVLVASRQLADLERQWEVFQALKREVRLLAYGDADAARLFDDLDKGRRGATPIDWAWLYALAARQGAAFGGPRP